jgi:predicted glycoside hydrolase/deacetylase ChbG (UPF0249 family)
VANGSDFEGAVHFANNNRWLDIGVHLTLTEEKALSSREEAPTLVDEKGYLPKNIFYFLLRYCSGRIKIEDIHREIENQILRVINSSVRISHIDSHCHIHMLPFILNRVIGLAKKYQIRIIRAPFESLSINDLFYLRGWICLILFFLSSGAKKKLKRHKISYLEYTFGILKSGRLNSEAFSKIIKRFGRTPTEISELVCHPGTNCARLTYPHWDYNWEEETILLTAEKTRTLLIDEGIEPCYHRVLDD